MTSREFPAPTPPPGTPAAMVDAWVRGWVVPHNLCPFARASLPRMRIVTADLAHLGDVLADEVELLRGADAERAATTLVVLPEGVEDFGVFLDVADHAATALSRSGLDGIIQVATFHPDYVFDGEDEGDPAAFTNRAPFPVLHLLREADVTAAVDAHPDPEDIPARNQALLRRMGTAEILARLQALGMPVRGGAR